MAMYQLAQVNIALPVELLTSQRLAEFVALLEPVNALADAAPGFVWRLQTEDGDATAVRAFDDDRLIVNMSVWESVESLRDFVYRNPEHRAIMRERRRFFVHLREAIQVLWWVPAGHIPTVEEAEERLELLRAHGPTPEAFTFRVNFPPPGAGAAVSLQPPDEAGRGIGEGVDRLEQLDEAGQAGGGQRLHGQGDVQLGQLGTRFRNHGADRIRRRGPAVVARVGARRT